MKKLREVMLLAAVVLAGSLIWSKLAFATFNPNDIIDDGTFNNIGTMNASQIDAWLNTHFSSSCISTNNGFSAPDPTGYNPTNGFLYGGNVSAGQVIYDSAQAYQLNPQVLLTTLQKEQSLVDGSAGCSTLRYAAATGYGCPDGGTTYNYSGIDLYSINGAEVTSVNGTCVGNSLQVGFSRQIIHAAWLLKFGEQRSEGNINWAIITGNWNNSDDPQTCYGGPMTQGTRQRCPSGGSSYYDGYTTIDGTSVHMDNGATATLYWYTPHLAGNQNFFDIFTNWFGSPYFTVNITYPIGDDAIDSSGDFAIIPVKLANAPLSTIQLNYGVSNTSIAKIIGNSSLIFTTSNWNTDQYITVEGLPSNSSSQDFSLYVLYINSPDGAYSQSITPYLTSVPIFWSNLSERAVYRLYNSSAGKHAYAVSNAAVSTLQSSGYVTESTLGYQCPGSTNTPLVVDNTNGLVRNIDSTDIINKETASPTIMYSNANGSTYVAILKNPAGTDTILSGDTSEISSLEQSGYTDITSFLLCKSTDVPIYRLYDPVSGSHFYTASSAESAPLLSVGFVYEGVGFYVNKNNTTPVYRLYDPVSGSHFYTASSAESNSAQSIGFKFEGIAFYAGSGTTPVYRLYDPVSGSHFYTASSAESNDIQGLGFKYEGIAFYLY